MDHKYKVQTNIRDSNTYVVVRYLHPDPDVCILSCLVCVILWQSTSTSSYCNSPVHYFILLIILPAHIQGVATHAAITIHQASLACHTSCL